MSIVRLIILFFAMAVSPSAIAQSGSVTYAHTRSLLSLPTDQIGGIVSDLDEVNATHSTITMKLTFDGYNSIMYPSINDSYEPGNSTSDGKEIGWEFVDTTFVVHGETRYIESRLFYDAEYLVQGHLPEWSWKLESGQERKYLGFLVLKATSDGQYGSTEAWFTPEILTNAGPGLFYGLPGLILMVTNHDTGEVYAAEEINIGEQLSPIVPPIAGKQVNTDEYDSIVQRVIFENQIKWEKARDILRFSPRIEGFGN
ncbi:MAG: GLPGLI family protein [Bacteroidetes bacterium]|nr:GLPGLI family protein [Bacteroidota bacterium]MCY4224728.1 GLPGLI family protein [Bacteroidota bacterium]